MTCWGLIIFTVAVICLAAASAHHDSVVPLSANEAHTIRESIIPTLKKWTEVFAAVGVLTIVSLFLIVIKPDFFKSTLQNGFFLPHKLKDKVFGFYDSLRSWFENFGKQDTNGMDAGAFSRNLDSRWSGNISPRIFSFHMTFLFYGRMSCCHLFSAGGCLAPSALDTSAYST